MRPVVNLEDLALNHWSQGSKYEASDLSFGASIGLKNIGIRYSEVPPGKSSCPFHNHHVEEEVFIIVSGEGTYRMGSETFTVRQGDVLTAPAGGRETAHQILNTGTAPLKYVGLSTNSPFEVVEYPDSAKFLVSSLTESGRKLRFIGREGASSDYWEDEPGSD